MSLFLVVGGNLWGMAKTVVVQSVCDLCQSPEVTGTYRFGWDLTNYEADLCHQHSNELIEVMERLVSSSRRLGSKAKSVEVPAPAASPRDRASTLEVRRWAKQNGIAVSERGRIPDELFEQFLSSKSSRARSS